MENIVKKINAKNYPRLVTLI